MRASRRLQQLYKLNSNNIFKSQLINQVVRTKLTRSSIETVDLSFTKVSQEDGVNSTNKPLPLVIVHGLFGSKMNFYTFSRAQSREHNRDCYLVDLRNHGASGHHNTDMSLRSMGFDLFTFLDDQGIEKCDLLGFSLGGKVSMSACLIPENQGHFDANERIRRLIVGDIAPVKYNSEDWDIPDVLGALNALDQHVKSGSLSKRSEADEILKQNGIQSDGVRNFLLTNLDRSQNNEFFWKFNLQGLTNNVTDIADFPFHPEDKATNPYTPFTNPTLFIVGEKSRLAQMQSAKVSAIVNDFFPNNQTTVFHGCGHWVHTENPKLFKQTVENFLNAE